MHTKYSIRTMKLLRLTNYVDCSMYVWEKQTKVSTPLRENDVIIELIFEIFPR